MKKKVAVVAVLVLALGAVVKLNRNRKVREELSDM